jgi:hypothetical protein
MKKQKTTLAEQVFAILKDFRNYYTAVDYCYPEALHPNDRAEIEESAKHFRDNISLEEVADETEDWQAQFEAMPTEEQPLLIACHIMDSNADHGIYNTVSVYLNPAE